MTGIIDFRLRPPLGDLLKSGLWDEAAIRKYSRIQGVEPAPSALARSIDMLIAEMDEAGITVGVMNGRQTSGFLGEVSNESLAKIVDQYHGRFVALAGANPTRGAENVKEAEYWIRDHGFKGISLDPVHYGEAMFADNPSLFPYYEVCIKYDAPVVLTIGPMCGGHDMSYAGALQVDRLATLYPQLKIVVSHGCWPYVLEATGVCARKNNVFLMPDMYFLGLPGEQDYVNAIRTFADGQFLFGTAYPSGPLKHAVDGFRALALDERAFKKVTYANAARLLKLDGAAI